MGLLVDYSDSDSESEAPKVPAPKTTAAPQSTSKKPGFQKLVDKSNNGKILVSLPTAAAAASTPEAAPGDEPAAKRLKTSGGSRFGGFSSFLPPPKATAKTPAAQSSSRPAPRVGVHLKTSSEAAFSRESPTAGDGGAGLSLPPPKASAQPSIPEGQLPEDEVKLVGKPLMFRPLSVSRKPAKKNKSAFPKAPPTVTNQTTGAAAAVVAVPEEPKAEPPKKKISLFSISDDAPTAEAPPEMDEYTGYEDSTMADGSYNQYLSYTQPALTTAQAAYPPPTATNPDSLDSIADDLNLDPAARRALFGREGRSNKTATKVLNFNMDREYQHNEDVRAAGETQQAYNPVRAIAPGKHNLKQLVNAVQSQKEALEESFAKNKSTKREAGSKYGF